MMELTSKVRQMNTNNRTKHMRILSLFICSLLTSGLFADDTVRPKQSPIGISITEEVQFPNAQTDIMGFRLCLLYGRHVNVSGFDLGVIGCGVDGYLFGLQTSVILNDVCAGNGAMQLSGIANNCLDDFSGFQISGIANSVGGIVYGGQCGGFNAAKELRGTQIGLFNKTENAYGIQIGVINWTKSMHGVQMGLLNVIEQSNCPYMILVNANF